MVEPESASDSADIPWSVNARVVASVLVAFHVFAVFVAPWSSPPPSSDLSRLFGDAMFPYLKAIAIDNGYRFFAPDPGPSNLVRYEVDFADGKTRSWEFPDPQRHWPRLYYHRHFMLAETLAGMYGEAQSMPPLDSMSEEDRRLAKDQLDTAEHLKRSVAAYLLRQHEGGERIRMFVRTHHIPTPLDIQRGMRLDDEKLYQEFPLAEYTREIL